MTPRSRRRLATAAALGLALAVPAVAAADDCGIEGTYFSGRSALAVTDAGATLGTFAAGSEATDDVRAFTFDSGTPRATELSSSKDSKLSTPVFLLSADGTTGAVYATASGIVVAWAGADPRLLVPGIAYNDVGDDVLGAAVAADGALTIAYADPEQLFASDATPPTVHLARFDATGKPVGTLDLPERSATTSLATVAEDGTTLVVGSDAKSAYRWSPGATMVQAIPLPYAPGRPADDDALLPDGQGGAWLRAEGHVLHVGPTAAVAVRSVKADTTVVVGAGGDALFGHGASIAVVDPSGRVVSDTRATGVVKGAGVVSVLAVASGSGARPAAVLLGQVRRKRRTLTLVRPDGRRATITAKARNFTTDAQLAVLADGAAWAVWQDGHAYFDQTCDAPSVDDQSVQGVRVPRTAKRAAPKALRDAHLTVQTSP